MKPSKMKPLKITLLVAALACTLPILGGCATDQEPAIEQARVVTAPHEPFAKHAAAKTPTVVQSRVQASPMVMTTPGAATQSPQSPYASIDNTREDESDGAPSMIGEIITAPFRLVASVVGFIL
jgi:hypothetical protein